MQLFYAPDIVPPEYTLSEEESKHCIRVLRMACGEELHITDGRGNLYRCEIVDDNPKRCRVRVRDTNSEFGKLPYRLTMAVAPTKTTTGSNGSSKKPRKSGSRRSSPSPRSIASDARSSPNGRTRSSRLP